jgi:hypothetical protein
LNIIGLKIWNSPIFWIGLNVFKNWNLYSWKWMLQHVNYVYLSHVTCVCKHIFAQICVHHIPWKFMLNLCGVEIGKGCIESNIVSNIYVHAASYPFDFFCHQTVKDISISLWNINWRFLLKIHPFLIQAVKFNNIWNAKIVMMGVFTPLEASKLWLLGVPSQGGNIKAQFSNSMKLIHLLSSLWLLKRIPRKNNQQPPKMGRPKQVKRGVNLGLPHHFQWNKAKGLCVGLVKVLTWRNAQIRAKHLIWIHIFRYQKMWIVWSWRSWHLPSLLIAFRPLSYQIY